LVVAYIIRQCGDNLIHGWLMRRIGCYAKHSSETWSVELCTYAAARDAACWKLNRAEPAVWLLLGGIEACLNDGFDSRARYQPSKINDFLSTH
jgi:hypothetical protein